MAVLKRRDSHIFERPEDDWFVEPRWVSDALFGAEDFRGAIFDPACGQGNILESAKQAGLTARGSDIVARRPVTRGRSVCDFFAIERQIEPNIVTNPPFGRAILAEKFIRHAFRLKPEKLAVFVDIRFLFGQARAARLFAEFPPARVWLIVPRPSCPPGAYLEAGHKAGGGTADYCWVVWLPRGFSDVAPGAASIGWLRGTP